MGRTIIKLGRQPGIDTKGSSLTTSVDEPVSAESALSRVTGEGACIVDNTLLRKYLGEKHLKASTGENVLGVLAAEATSESSALNSKNIIYEDWKS